METPGATLKEMVTAGNLSVMSDAHGGHILSQTCDSAQRYQRRGRPADGRITAPYIQLGKCDRITLILRQNLHNHVILIACGVDRGDLSLSEGVV